MRTTLVVPEGQPQGHDEAHVEGGATVADDGEDDDVEALLLDEDPH